MADYGTIVLAVTWRPQQCLLGACWVSFLVRPALRRSARLHPFHMRLLLLLWSPLQQPQEYKKEVTGTVWPGRGVAPFIMTLYLKPQTNSLPRHVAAGAYTFRVSLSTFTWIPKCPNPFIFVHNGHHFGYFGGPCRY